MNQIEERNKLLLPKNINLILDQITKKKKKKKKKKKIILIVIQNIKLLNKCKIFIILNDKKKVLKYENLYNYFEKEFDVFISISKHKIKNEIRTS